MKIQVLIPLWGIAFAGVLSCAVICPVYGQEVRVRQIGQPSPSISSDTVTRAATAVTTAPIVITPATTVSIRTFVPWRATLLGFKQALSHCLNGFLWKLAVPV